MASITIRALSFLLPYSLCNNSRIPYNRGGGRGLENVLKIKIKRVGIIFGVSKIEFMYISISYFYTFFQILRRSLKKILSNVDLT